MKVGRIERMTPAGPRIVYTTETGSEPIAEIPEIPLPEFPRLTGPIDELVRGITSDLPYEHKVLCALTVVGLQMSGWVQLATDPFLQPRFYACMIGPPSTGKSASEKEITRALLPIFPNIRAELSVDSGPALVEALAEHSRLLLSVDELADTFEKARQTPASHNSLFGEFLRLYESNSTGRRVIKKNAEPIALSDVHLGIVGSATPERFDRMWMGTAGASGGLQSRFVLTYSEKALPTFKTPNRDDVIEASRHALSESASKARSVRLSGDAQDLISKWKGSQSSHPRVLDMVKRFALVLAASSDKNEIDADTMARALRFGDYQIAARERLMPIDASNWAQAFENRILAFFKRHPQASERDVRRSICPEKYPGGYGSFEQAIRGLVRAGKLVTDSANRLGKPLWRLD